MYLQPFSAVNANGIISICLLVNPKGQEVSGSFNDPLLLALVNTFFKNPEIAQVREPLLPTWAARRALLIADPLIQGMVKVANHKCKELLLPPFAGLLTTQQAKICAFIGTRSLLREVAGRKEWRETANDAIVRLAQELVFPVWGLNTLMEMPIAAGGFATLFYRCQEEWSVNFLDQFHITDDAVTEWWKKAGPVLEELYQMTS